MPVTLPTRELNEIAGFVGERVHEFSGTTALISGGCGFLGRYFPELFAYLNEHVLEKPCNLVVLDNQITSSAGNGFLNDLPNVTFIERDIVEEFHWDEPLDYIIHTAGNRQPVLLCQISAGDARSRHGGHEEPVGNWPESTG